ncbi:28235_t:CDS:2, partial [Dentiscutata erythropus]
GLGSPTSILQSQLTQLTSALTEANPTNPLQNLTAPCVNAIIAFIGNATTCLPPSSLALLLPVLTDTDPVKKLNDLVTFANSTCSFPRCSDNIIDLGKNLTLTGCSSDIQNKNPVAIATVVVIMLYLPIMNSLCFQTPNKDYCFQETAFALFAAPDPKFNPPLIGPGLDKFFFCNPTTFCTDCNHKISREFFGFLNDKKHADDIAILTNFGFKDLITEVQNSIMIKCGFTFLTD